MLKFLKQYSEITAVMSERNDGSMKLAGNNENNLKNRKIFFTKAGIDPVDVVSALLANGSEAQIIENRKNKIITGIDALVTSKKNLYLSITVADCVPVFFYEPRKKIIGIVHAGWRGIIGNIIGNTLETIKKLDGNINELEVFLGPGINACHFEIKEDVVDKFAIYSSYIIKRDNKIFVDLKGMLRKQLLKCGIEEDNIENNDDCTFEHKRYFSNRRDKPQVIEAMIAVIGIK